MRTFLQCEIILLYHILLHGTLSLDVLENVSPKEDDIPPYLTACSDTYTDNSERTMKNYKYPLSNKDDKDKAQCTEK